jgi:hypothetical protein
VIRFFDSRVVTPFDENRGRESKSNVEIIALNLERFVSFEMLYLRFINSCQFLNASLEDPVDSLVKSCDKPLKNSNILVCIWVQMNYHLQRVFSHAIISIRCKSSMIRRYLQKMHSTTVYTNGRNFR